MRRQQLDVGIFACFVMTAAAMAAAASLMATRGKF